MLTIDNEFRKLFEGRHLDYEFASKSIATF